MNKRTLLELGVDFDGAVKRFCGNNKLYYKCLAQFLHDDLSERMLKSVREGNSEEAFFCAHTIKGACGNLGFISLFTYADGLTESVRPVNNNYPAIGDEAMELANRYKSEWERIKSALIGK